MLLQFLLAFSVLNDMISWFSCYLKHLDISSTAFHCSAVLFFLNAGTFYYFHSSQRMVFQKLSPAEKKKYDLGFQNNAFNQYASDMISIHRTLPEILDKE